MSQLTDTFTAIANAIRTMREQTSSVKYKPNQMASGITSITKSMYLLDWAESTDLMTNYVGSYVPVPIRLPLLISKATRDLIISRYGTNTTTNITAYYPQASWKWQQNSEGWVEVETTQLTQITVGIRTYSSASYKNNYRVNGFPSSQTFTVSQGYGSFGSHNSVSLNYRYSGVYRNSAYMSPFITI